MIPRAKPQKTQSSQKYAEAARVPWQQVQVQDPNTPPLARYVALVEVVNEAGPRRQLIPFRAEADCPDLGKAAIRAASALGFIPIGFVRKVVSADTLPLTFSEKSVPSAPFEGS